MTVTSDIKMQAHGAQTDYKEQRRGTRASGKHEQSREKRHARDRRVNVRERGKATSDGSPRESAVTSTHNSGPGLSRFPPKLAMGDEGMELTQQLIGFKQ